jgi:hypothetical protein
MSGGLAEAEGHGSYFLFIWALRVTASLEHGRRLEAKVLENTKGHGYGTGEKVHQLARWL